MSPKIYEGDIDLSECSCFFNSLPSIVYVILHHLGKPLRLLKIHKNMLFDAILDSHLNPSDFDYREDRQHIKINVHKRRFYFNFASDRFTIFPFKNLYTSHEYLTSNNNFEEYIYRLNLFFKDWLKLISLEMRTEDRWESFIKKSKNVPIIDSINFAGDKLGYVEVKDLAQNCMEAKKAIEKLNINAPIKIKIFETLAYLANRSKTIELKDDWINMAKGILISELVKINRNVYKEEFQKIMAILRIAFKPFFTFGF